MKIKFFSIYIDYVDKEFEIELKGKCIELKELLEILYSKYSDLKEIFNRIIPIILVNGKPVEVNHIVCDDDEIAFIPPASGG